MIVVWNLGTDASQVMTLINEEITDSIQILQCEGLYMRIQNPDVQICSTDLSKDSHLAATLERLHDSTMPHRLQARSVGTNDQSCPACLDGRVLGGLRRAEKAHHYIIERDEYAPIKRQSLTPIH